jgi:hypothetical protein
MVQEKHYNSIDNEKDTSVQRRNYYSLLDLTKAGDTIGKDEPELSGRFRQLVDKATR